MLGEGMTGEPIWFFANYGRIEGELSSVMLALAMLGMGASLTVRDFVAVFRLWRGFAVGMVVQFVLIPVKIVRQHGGQGRAVDSSGHLAEKSPP